ncbi:MAG: hypothetical protein OCC49_17075 [Fibrobacterales bacterium]
MDNRERDQEIERESKRQLHAKGGGSLASALSEKGSDFLSGGSPIPLILQAETAIASYINSEVRDSCGALKATLQIRIKRKQSIIAEHIDTPLAVLKTMIALFLEKEPLLFDFVREVDACYGNMYQERPHFQRPGAKAHPDDEYTHESVRESLEELYAKLQAL